MSQSSRDASLKSFSQLSRNIAAGALLSMLAFPLGANAAMTTVDRSELEGMDVVADSGFAELYQDPDIGNLTFHSIYIAPVVNEVASMDVYDMGLRPYHIDALGTDFRERVIAAFGDSSLLTDTPDENSLVITLSLIEVARMTEVTTGSHLARASIENTIRGGANIEMTWRKGVEGDLVMAIRDGRRPEQYDPVAYPGDRWTDVKGAFDDWSTDMAGFFGIEPQQVASN